MVTLRLARHAQSEANAGLATCDPDRMPLTDLGRRQAHELAQSWTWPTDSALFFWVSPASRALATLAPTTQRYPHAQVNITPDAAEFTPFNFKTVPSMTPYQRKPIVDAYFDSNDPSVKGVDGESFHDFYERVLRLMNTARHSAPDLIVTHGGTMCLLRLLLDPAFQRLDSAAAMREFRLSIRTTSIDNCEVFELELRGNPSREEQ